MVADLGVEGVAVGVGDVGGVADDGVEGFGFGGSGGEQVGLEEADAVGDVVGLGVGGGRLEGVGGDVEGGDVGVGEVDGEGDGDGSGAGAYVGDAEGLVCGQELRTASTRCSVSGRGMRTAGVTWRARP